MLLSMNWISDFVDLSGVDLKKLIDRFTLATAEVEEVCEYGKDIRDVVIGKVLSMEPHPESKKLHLLKVDHGTGVVDCVCGAPNVFQGALVAFAKCGGSVKGMEIGEAMVAGYQSLGMCCSEKELGISENHAGIMIFEDLAIGTDIKSIMQLEDTVFEVDNKSLTNRPDLWGHYGIAREIATLLKRPLKELPVYNTHEFHTLPAIDLKIESEHCFRYSCICVNQVTKSVSPYNLKIRLTYCGQRPINLLADLTNYLMLELGQPMHAFDQSKVSSIRVKAFAEQKKFQTLDGSERMIEPGVMMICDQDEPVAIAGIMGGLLSEIENNTTTLLLESANFDGVAVRKNATKLGMRTEASSRYEKTIDPEMTVPAIERFLKLLFEVDPEARVTSCMTDVYAKKYETIMIQFDKAYVDKYTGIDITEDEIEETLRFLEFQITRKGDQFEVVVPSFRATKDVTIKADIIEEITRIYGYDNFELKSTPSLLAPVREDAGREGEYRIKQLLADRYGFSEVHSYIWYDAKQNKELGIEAPSDVHVVNSVTGENGAIRQSIIPILLGFVNRNMDAGSEVKMFEIGRVVRGIKEDGLCNECKVLSLVFASKEKSEHEVLAQTKAIMDYLASELKHQDLSYDSCAKIEAAWIHPKNSAVVKIGEQEIGYLSILNPKIADKIDKKMNAAVLEIDYALFEEAEWKEVKFQEVSKFPGINIDLSLLVDKNMQFGSLCSLISSYYCNDMQSIHFVGVFDDPALPEGKHSMTIRMQFISYENTLSGEEVNNYVQDILKLLSKEDIILR